MLQGLLKPFVGFRRKALNVGIIILLIQLFLLIAADYIYGQYAEVVRSILIVYFFMFVLTRVTLGGRPSTLSPKESWSSFLIMFVFTSVILLVGSIAFLNFQSSANLTEAIPAAVGATALGFGALHAFVKAYIEEDVFRNALPIHAGLGDIISNILFGVFHFAVLVNVRGLGMIQAIFPIVILVILGLIWSRVRNGFGIMGSTGSHFAWNLFAFGVLGKIFTGGLV
jgi:hypothetical protein